MLINTFINIWEKYNIYMIFSANPYFSINPFENEKNLRQLCDIFAKIVIRQLRDEVLEMSWDSHKRIIRHVYVLYLDRSSDNFVKPSVASDEIFRFIKIIFKTFHIIFLCKWNTVIKKYEFLFLWLLDIKISLGSDSPFENTHCVIPIYNEELKFTQKDKSICKDFDVSLQVMVFISIKQHILITTIL